MNENDPTTTPDITAGVGAFLGDVGKLLRQLIVVMAFAGWVVGFLSAWLVAAVLEPDVPSWPLFVVATIGATGALIARLALGSPDLWERQVRTLKDNVLVLLVGLLITAVTFAAGLALG